jgi:17beta-estradiol 17-dehydrogenase/3beta-hydroxysteroid 3-dehydrogenase
MYWICTYKYKYLYLYMHLDAHSLEPYESSKWATDLMSILVSEQYEQQNKKVSSYITSPGVVASGIAGLPGWVVAARVLCHHLLRFCGVTSQTVTARNGSVSNIYAALQTNLSYLNRYCSCVDRWGNPFVEARSIPDYDPITAEKLTQR